MTTSTLSETSSSTNQNDMWIRPHPALDGVALIDHLFNRLDGLYPLRWRSAFANDTAIANWRTAWAESLTDERVTMAEIKRGLAVCRKRIAWPPSFAEFLTACRPALDAEQAFYEAVRQMQKRESGADSWSNPALFWAASRLGGDLMRYAYETVKNRWKSELDKALSELRAGSLPTTIPDRRVALPPPTEPASQSIAESKAKIAALRSRIEQKWRMEAA